MELITSGVYAWLPYFLRMFTSQAGNKKRGETSTRRSAGGGRPYRNWIGENFRRLIEIKESFSPSKRIAARFRFVASKRVQ